MFLTFLYHLVICIGAAIGGFLILSIFDLLYKKFKRYCTNAKDKFKSIKYNVSEMKRIERKRMQIVKKSEESTFWILRERNAIYLLDKEPIEKYSNGDYVFSDFKFAFLKNSWFTEITEDMGPVRVTIKIEEE